MNKLYLNWSSGKDAAMALFELQKEGKHEVKKLVTTINSETERISMHGVRRELLQRQAESLQIPLHLITLSGDTSLEQYNKTMAIAVEELKKEGFTQSVFGDIFLEDLRKYREIQLEKEGIKPLFPLWKRNTAELIRDFIAAGFKAICICVNSKSLDSSYCGRIVDLDFVNSLPEGVDPCGENGEFHTFVFDGPIFKEPIDFKVGEVVEKFYTPTKEKKDCFTKEKSWDTSFWYCDLLPT